MIDFNKDELIELVKKKDAEGIRNFFDYYQGPDLAEGMKALDMAEIVYVFHVVHNSIASEVFSYIDPEEQERIINSVTEEKIDDILSYLSSDDYVDVLDSLPANLVTQILRRVPKDKRGVINALLNYENGTAGALMTVEYIKLKKIWNAKEALSNIKKDGFKAETISYCYVIDETRKLIGSLKFRDIFFAEESETIDNLMESNPVSIHVNTHQEEVTLLFKKYDLNALPVVNDENCLIGIITVDDIIDAIDQEVTEDIHKMAAIRPQSKPYFAIGVLAMAKSRVMWLMILMISATATGLILGKFEHALIAVPILVTAIPMLMDTGGNSAAQASAMVIRGLALGEINIHDWFRVFRKEVMVAAICGAALAVVNVGRMMIQLLITGSFDSVNVRASFVMSITLVIVVIFAKIFGSLLPLVAKKIKLDPAVMAGPVVTTIIDACALTVYFVLANLFFSSMM